MRWTAFRSCTASAASPNYAESTLDHLAGYENARPVRIGNGAYDQDQHDVWGAILDSIYLHTRSRDHLPERIWPFWRSRSRTPSPTGAMPDRGIWEVRSEPKHFTSSKMMCWVACDRGARLAEMKEEWETAKRWQQAADEIHADILAPRPRRTGRLHAALRHRRPRRLGPPHAARAFPAGRRRAGRGHRAGHRRRAHAWRVWSCATGWRRPTTGWPATRARSRSARSGSWRHWSRSARSTALGRCASACCHTPARWVSTPRRSTPAADGTWGISRRRSPIWP